MNVHASMNLFNLTQFHNGMNSSNGKVFVYNYLGLKMGLTYSIDPIERLIYMEVHLHFTAMLYQIIPFFVLP